MGDMPAILLEDISFGYAPGQTVFDGLHFELRAGEKVGLVGPNGSGKTTLFHLIMGLEKPQCGRVVIDGRERKTEADFREARTRIGLLFQNPDDQLFCPTVAEDVAFGPLNLGWGREEVAQAVRQTLAMLGISELEDRVAHRLSGGEKQLVALASVLAMRPSVLLLDEPTGALSEPMADRVAEIVQTRVSTCVISSHDRAFLARTVDRIYTLKDGCLNMLETS